jgi:capsular exopolysaccharide synthesis family protein
VEDTTQETIPGVRRTTDVATALWRHRLLVVAITLGSALAGYGASHLQQTLYSGTARLVLNDPRSSSVFDERRQPVLDPARYVRNRAEFMTSTLVLSRAEELLDGRLGVADIRARTTVEPAKELDLVTIRALDPTPEGAAELANAVATAYGDVVESESRRSAEAVTAELAATRADLQARIDVLSRQLAGSDGADNAVLAAQRAAAATELFALDSRADQISTDAELYGSGVQLFEPAEPASSPAQPSPLGAAAVAGFLGFLLALGLAWWRAEHRQSADGRQDAALVLGAPLLGEVPDFSAAGVTGSMPAHDAPNSVAGEAYHFLVASLGFSLRETGGSTVVVTSAGPSDGKTVTAINLAIAARQDGRRVLLVDADERARGLSRVAGLATAPGLTDLTDDAVPLASVTQGLDLSGGSAVAVVPAGAKLEDPAGFFRTSSFRKAMGRVKVAADLVIVDSPPLLAVSDTSAIASQADGIILVVRSGTSLRLLREMRERLEFVGTPVLGYVFNRADPRRGGSRYGYGYGYGYGAERPAGGRLRRPRIRARVEQHV